MIYYNPTVTVLTSTKFTAPPHMQVKWGDNNPNPDTGEHLIEFAGRLCYMSQHNPASKTNGQYIVDIMKQGHGSVLEHFNISMLFEGVSRSLSHELVRHRAGFAYSQLSQRYVDESEVGFVMPPTIAAMDDYARDQWCNHVMAERTAYVNLVESLMRQHAHIENATHRRKLARSAARSVLPECTETKVVVTANMRAWRHFLTLRGGEGADLEMRRLAIRVLGRLKFEAPFCVADMEDYTAESDGFGAIRCHFNKV